MDHSRNSGHVCDFLQKGKILENLKLGETYEKCAHFKTIAQNWWHYWALKTKILHLFKILTLHFKLHSMPMCLKQFLKQFLYFHGMPLYKLANVHDRESPFTEDKNGPQLNLKYAFLITVKSDTISKFSVGM